MTLEPSDTREAPVRARSRLGRRLLAALGALAALPFAFHALVAASTRIEPPPIAAAAGEPSAAPADGEVRLLGPAYARRRGKILEVRLAGSPEEIGHQHARLLYGPMRETEGVLYRQLETHVPFAPARWLILDLSRLRFREVDRGMSPERLREIAAEARAFSPDPFEGFLPTFHRFVFLQALYDISLSFERSPLLGCTSFALTDGAFEGGRAVLARNFDFEAGPVFDEGKAVFLVFEQGRLPYASVAWPGLVGAVTGMNASGVAAVVHGARAREPASEGEPVVHTMRELLGRARSTAEALEVLRARRPMVSHLIFVVDAAGDVAVVERAPGEPAHVRRGRGKVALTNHLEGPLAADPANRRIEASTSTLPRRKRLDELLANLRPGATVQEAVSVLRDKKGLGGVDVPLGDRRALDALIATHAVVLDATARQMWVSEGPHLAGRFVQFDLGRLLDPAYDPTAPGELAAVAEDAILTSGAYDAWVASGAPHGGEP